MPSKLSPKKRAKVHFMRAVNVIVLALNFWWSGGHFIEASLLKRTPSQSQRTIINRVVSLLQVDGPTDSFCVSGSGRRVPQLVARLCELSDCVTNLGIRSTPYDHTFEGREVAVDNTAKEELEPYRSLDSDRLLLHGTGHWDPTPWLSDTLVMAFRHPDVLLFDRDLEGVALPRSTDPMPEVVKLAQLWDRQSLLCIHSQDFGKLHPERLVRIFNCYKNSFSDRQIGDRRGRNAVEAKVEGPSRSLPTGHDLLDLHLDPQLEALSISVTDRRDYYHQLKATRSRAISNTVGPGIPWNLLKDTEAFSAFLLLNARTRRDRRLVGDDLGASEAQPSRKEDKWIKPSPLYIAFSSVLQGDHGGVEYACDAHVNFLKEHGLLQDTSRVTSDKPFLGSEIMEGLCIDDYFAVSKVNRQDLTGDPPDVQCFRKAQEAYQKEKILGSSNKDVVGQRVAKVVGAQIDSSEEALSHGLCTIGSPPSKRYSLSWITLMVCQLACTTDVLHVCLLGAWVSVLMYRRPLMSLLNKSFRLVNASQVDSVHPKLVRLPRTVVTELLLLAVLVPFAVSDLAAEFCEEVFCTDASLARGAICGAPIDPCLAKVLWSGLRSKGAYHRLLTPSEALLKKLNLSEELPVIPELSVERPKAFYYDFLEVFSGAATVTAVLAGRGFVVGPPIDLSLSEEFNMEWAHVCSWISFLICSRRVRSFLVSPPCTTFSIMRRPALRSKFCPYGFHTSCPVTALGNLLAHRGLQLLYLGLRYGVPGLFECPWAALTRHLPAYKSFLEKSHASATRCDSCMFGSIHLKSFRFLSVFLSLQRLSKRCDRSHTHVVIQGQYTKASATYVPALAECLGDSFVEAMKAMRSEAVDAEVGQAKGLESQLVNSIALSSEWSVLSSWKFPKPSHINILEMTALGRLATKLAKRSKSLRVSALVDSFVISAASSKGRTSSLGLGPSLRRYCAVCVASFLFFCVPFVPTRLNVADDPTRDVPLRPPCQALDFSQWSQEEFANLLGRPRLRRWASNWLRLLLRLLGPVVLSFSDRSSFRVGFHQPARPVLAPVDSNLNRSLAPMGGSLSESLVLDHATFDFDSTRGFPGEGPGLWTFQPGLRSVGVFGRLFLFPSSFFCFLSLSVFCPSLLVWFCFSVLCFSFVCFSFVLCVRAPLLRFTFLAMGLRVIAVEAAFAPRNPADERRAELRSSRQPLVPGRPVMPTTLLNRELLFNTFINWCLGEGCDFGGLLQNAMVNIEEINVILCRYGRELYHSGRPYGHFSETINSVASKKPAVRRHLQQCWDLAFAWVKAEPPVHHTAMPWQVLLGCLSTALLWGWPRMAGVLALTWGGILRIGETLKARRSDLLLPCDTDYTQGFALLAISEAKTRFTSARHQTSKLDIPDLVRVVSLAFQHLDSSNFLWPYSGSTLRLRFKSILSALTLSNPSAGLRPLDMGSLRAGGATWMLAATENGELVRRRGRWLSQRIMEIYLQETSAIRFMLHLSLDQRHRVMASAQVFPTLLVQCEQFTAASIPWQSWFQLFSSP
eukprot:Skav212494  [mRNA]  locus=scaffold2060:20226:24812:- [translate_table: standard]